MHSVFLVSILYCLAYTVNIYDKIVETLIF